MLAVSSHIPFLVAIRCLFDKWKLPFYSAMDYTLNKQWYQELLVHLYDIGLICKITCCDQGQFQYHQNQTNFLTFLYKNVSFDFSNTYAGYRVSLQVWNRLKKSMFWGSEIELCLWKNVFCSKNAFLASLWTVN